VVTNSLRLRASKLPGEKQMQNVTRELEMDTVPAGAGD
jgi:hypothetical protein